ncbi:MAG: hypothetical protein V4727_14410 [Verrucomicrobiota bacterium]
MLESSASAINLPSLRNDDKTPQRYGEGLPQSPFESAIDELRRNARTTGEESFELRQQAAIQQRAALLLWAEKSNLKSDPCLWQGRSTLGGSEHRIWGEDNEMWKVTHGDRLGWTVLPGDNGMPYVSEATPLEYLERWQNSNEVLGDFAKLRGVAESIEGIHVVVSHPFINGDYPSPQEVEHEMAKRGFLKIPNFSIGSEQETSYYNDDIGFGVFDASSDNFIMSENTPIPIDVIPIRVSNLLRSQLLRLIQCRLD